MKVSLTKELEKFISELVADGTYLSASEVVCAGLRLLQERENLKTIRIENFRTKILRGFEESQDGESEPLDIETIQSEGEIVLAEKIKEK